jgi:Ca-activated chloride channel family protein
MLLDLARPELFAGQSASLKKCLALAIRAMGAEKTQKKLLLVISDGEDHDTQALALTQEAAQKGFVIYAIGVGTLKGGPIPLLNDLGEIEDWKRDEKKLLRSCLDFSKTILENENLIMKNRRSHIDCFYLVVFL